MTIKKYIYSTVLCSIAVLASFSAYAQDSSTIDVDSIWLNSKKKEPKEEKGLIPVAYGKQSFRNTTSAISNISSNVIEKNAVSSIEQGMNGTLPGVFSIKTGGQKFGKSNFNFYVRGMATTANAQPLILVDGMEANIDLMDFNEVESITVLKDATALAMYGMRGANGVILITTKHGTDSGYKFKLNIKAGVQQAQRINSRLNSYQYTTLYNEGLVNDGQSPMYNPDIYLSDTRDPYLYPDEDFKDRFLKSSSPYQHYNFSSSGGSSIAKYFVTAGYLKQDGLFKDGRNNNYERYNFRSNIDVDLIDNLYFNVLASGAIDRHLVPYTGDDEVKNNAVNSVNSIFNTMMTLPSNAFPLFNKNGSLGGTAEYQNNPYGMLNRTGSRTDEARLFTTLLKLKYDFSDLVDGLSADMSFGFESFNNQFKRRSNKYAVFQETPGGLYTQFGLDDSKDDLNSFLISDFYRYTMLNVGAEYQKTVNAHSLYGRLIYSQSVETATGDNPDYKYQGVSFRFHYGYNQRYFAEFTGAYQGSNNFKRGSRCGFFPAGGLAWILSEENFLKEVKPITFLKLRTSYGLTGNDQTGGRRFPYRQTYSIGGGYLFGNNSGYAEGTQKGVLPNENEKWEKAYKFNVGLDLNLLNDLTFSFDFFKEHRTDILVDYANVIPNVIGTGLSKYNAGVIDNKGIEMSLMYNKKVNDWEFTVGGHLLWAKNKIKDLKEIAYQYPHQYRKGHSISTVFGYQTNGIYTTNEQLNNAPVAQFGRPSLGDIIYVNQNPEVDNMIDTRDQVALGNSFPELIYRFNLGASYKGFDVECYISGSERFYTHFVPSKFSTYTWDNRWDPNNPSVATAYPRLSISENYNQQTSDYWQRKAHLLRISSVELGYTLPQSLVKKASLSDVRVFFNVNNVCSFSNVKDKRDPEALNAGYSEFPLLRTYAFGLSINL